MRSWTSGFFLLRPAALVAGAWFGQATAVLATGPDPAIDDFERPSLGTNWTRLGGSSAEIVNGHDLGVPNTVGCAVSWSASTFLADQFSETVLAQDKPPNMLTQVYVRMRSTDRARYGFHFNGDPGNSRWEIKFDGVPTAQTRILASVPGSPPVPGDTLRIEAYGSTIRGYLNGQVLLTSVDTAPDRITTTGPAGVVARNAQGTTNTPPTPIFASWKGGSLDADGDHVGDSIDNCPTIPNHTQANADGDVRGDACDCAPADPGSFAVPDEIEGVSFLTEGETLIWTSLASSSGSATSYEVYRELENGGPAGSSPGGSCANPPPTGTVFVDSEVPPIGTAWRYLVRGRNACGAGTWGSASNGTPRPVGNCP